MSRKIVKRNRGQILSRQGWQKIQDAKVEWELTEKQGYKVTLEEMGERAGLTTPTIRKILTRDEGVDKRSIATLFSALNLELTEDDCTKPTPREQSNSISSRIDWGEAFDVSIFYGRTKELETLERWMVEDRRRLISIVGIGGIGKTALSIKITEQVESKFEYIIWRSLRDTPPIQEILLNLIQFLSEPAIVIKDIPESVSEQITLLVGCLRSSRCLIVLDNIESLMSDDNRAGIFREEYQEYSQLFQRLGESEHQSCVLLTAREKPREIAVLEGELLPVCSLQLDGFEGSEGSEILKQKGLEGTATELANLVQHYNGNPLAIKIAATTIRDLFEGNITEFLRQDTAIFGDIRDILSEQFQRLIDIEEKIIYWLAINREPITLEQLQTDLVDSVTQFKLIDGLESLSRRSLIDKAEYNAAETGGVRFTLQSVIMEYVTNQLIEKVCQEIATQELELLRFYALVKATAKDYIKETQKRLILKPLTERLLDILGSQNSIEKQLNQIKTKLQETSPRQTGYVAGNILNLLSYLGTDLTGSDFSNLCIWQADLQNVFLHDVSFQNADLSKTVFCESFGSIMSVAFSPDGEIIAAGDSNGEIRLWSVADNQPLKTFRGHSNWTVALDFSPNSKILASSSSDNCVKLWDVETAQCLNTLEEHQGEVWSICFSFDGKVVASGSDDNTVKLWNVKSGKCLRTFRGHTSWVTSVAFNSDAKVLVSGSDDNTVKLWDVETNQCLKTLKGHSSGIRAVAFNSNDLNIASGSEDKTVKLWDIETGKCLKTLKGHKNRIFSVAFDTASDLIASGSHDNTVKLWNTNTGKCWKTFDSHSNWIFDVVFSPDGQHLASGSRDQTVKLWNIHTSQCVKTFQGYSNQILSVSFSPDGQYLASGSYDNTVRLWNLNIGKVSRTFRGHSNWVYCITFNSRGNYLASCSGDKTVRLWDVSTGKVRQILRGHNEAVRTIAFHPDGQTIASGSEDQTVRLWDVSTGQIIKVFEINAEIWSIAFSPDGNTLAIGTWNQTIELWNLYDSVCFEILKGHTNWVWSVVFSNDGNMLASSSSDGTLKLWDVHTGNCQKTLKTDVEWLLAISFCSDKNTLITTCQDCTIRLWDISKGKCTKILRGHKNGWIWSVSFCSNNQIIASGSEDETIKLWSLSTGECLETLEIDQPYKNLNIQAVDNLTEAAINTVKTLGGFD